jgi:hypothetical protein
MTKTVIIDEARIRQLAASKLFSWLNLPPEAMKKGCKCNRNTADSKEIFNKVKTSLLGCSPEDKTKMRQFLKADVLKVYINIGNKLELITL